LIAQKASRAIRINKYPSRILILKESSLPLVFRPDPDLVVTAYQINLRIYASISQHVQSSMSSNRGIGNLYFIVLLLMARLSMHILQVPSFLGVSNAGTAQGLMLSRISSFRTNSITCRLSSSCSAGLILYAAARLGSVEPSIGCWMSLIGGNLSGNSFAVMSSNYCRSSPIRPGSGVGGTSSFATKA